MDRNKNKRMEKSKDKRMDKHKNKRMEKSKDKKMDKNMNFWMKGWMKGNEWKDKRKNE